MKHCKACKMTKDTSEFHRDSSRVGGYDNRCKPCTKERDASRKRKRSKEAEAAHDHSRRGAKASVWTYRFIGDTHRPACAACDKTEDLTYDHITPIKLGGTSDWWNFQLLCRSCNSKKGATEVFYSTEGKVVDSIGF